MTRFLPIALVLGLLTGGLGATLDALPAAATAPDGWGAMTVLPTAVTTGSTGNTLVFTYNAGAGVLASGQIKIIVPGDWSTPQTTTPAAVGYTTSNCGTPPATTVSVVGQTITVIDVNGSGTCTITYSDATAPPSAEVSTFTASEESTSDSMWTTLLVSPQVTVGSTIGVYAVSFFGSSMTAGATGTTWTVDFTTSTPLVAGDEIAVTFPAGFSVPSGTVVLGPAFTAAGCTYSSALSSGTTVVIVLAGGACALPASSVTLQITGITNPAAGTYDNTLFYVSTTFDTAGSPAADVVITGVGVVTPPAPNTVYGVTFSGSSMSGGATNTTWTVGFTTSDPNGALGPGYAISVTFAAGFVIPLNPAVTLGSGFYGCTATPQATAVASGTTVLITLGAGCHLNASTSATVTIAGITNPAAGSYANTSFAVSTSVDFAASPAAAVAITGATVPTVTTSCAGSTGNAAFLCSVYEHLLGRAPDAGGLASFEGLLAAGVSRAQVAYDIATSPEYRSDLVGFFYQFLLGRAADPGGLVTWVGALNAGWSDQQVLEGMMGSAEFYAHAGGTPSGFVSALYMKLLGRAADSGGLATWVGALNAGWSRNAVVAGILYSNEYKTNFVEGEYMNLLGRAADPGGLATWLSQLAHGVSNEWVIALIVGSPEFYALSQ